MLGRNTSISLGDHFPSFVRAQLREGRYPTMVYSTAMLGRPSGGRAGLLERPAPVWMPKQVQHGGIAYISVSWECSLFTVLVGGWLVSLTPVP